jgi:hypothetical protein
VCVCVCEWRGGGGHARQPLCSLKTKIDHPIQSDALAEVVGLSLAQEVVKITARAELDEHAQFLSTLLCDNADLGVRV